MKTTLILSENRIKSITNDLLSYENLLKKEMAYSPDLRKQSTIDRLTKSINDVKEILNNRQITSLFY